MDFIVSLIITLFFISVYHYYDIKTTKKINEEIKKDIKSEQLDLTRSYIKEDSKIFIILGYAFAIILLFVYIICINAGSTDPNATYHLPYVILFAISAGYIAGFFIYYSDTNENFIKKNIEIKKKLHIPLDFNYKPKTKQEKIENFIYITISFIIILLLIVLVALIILGINKYLTPIEVFREPSK